MTATTVANPTSIRGAPRAATARRLLQRPVLVVWSAYVLLIPFYVIKAGLPQPGDLLIVPLVPMAVAGWNGRMSSASLRALRPLLLFTGWVCVVSLVWAAILWSWNTSLLYPLYYVYNTAFFFSALVLYRRFGDDFLRLTVQLVFVSVVSQVLLSFVGPGGGRAELYFSNPNQLGYYASLSACVIALTQRKLELSLFRSSIGLSCCGYLAILSSSRSSLAGIVFLLMLMVFSNPRILIAAGFMFAALAMVETPIDHSIERLEERVSENRNPHLSFFESRGYDRIWRNKEYVLMGAAEGNRSRFKHTTALGSAEIHSSIGTVIFSYGVIGTALFVAFLWQLMKGAPLRAGFLLLPPFIYSTAHQGLRFTMLWVLLALFVALKESRR